MKKRFFFWGCCMYVWQQTKNKNLTLTSKRVDYYDSRSYTINCDCKKPTHTNYISFHHHAYHCGMCVQWLVLSFVIIKLFLLLLQTQNDPLLFRSLDSPCHYWTTHKKMYKMFLKGCRSIWLCVCVCTHLVLLW